MPSNYAQSYSKALRPLFQQGDPDLVEDWSLYQDLGITIGNLSELGQLATDFDVLEVEEDADWAVVHAWRTLAMLQDPGAIAVLMQVLQKWGQQETAAVNPMDFDAEFDWVSEEMPIVFGRTGLLALRDLQQALFDKSAPLPIREVAALAIAEIAKNFPASKAACVAMLVEQLTQFEQHPPAFSGFLIDALVQLQAIEVAPIIEQVLASDRIQAALPHHNWERIQVFMGLKKPAQFPTLGETKKKKTLRQELFEDASEESGKRERSASEKSSSNPHGLSPFVLSKLSKPKNKGKSTQSGKKKKRK